MNLKELRKVKRMTCEELATACGVSIHTMRAYECGARMMSADMLHRIAVALEVMMDDAYMAYIKRIKKGANT